jgi:hypothetical protein
MLSSQDSESSKAPVSLLLLSSVLPWLLTSKCNYILVTLVWRREYQCCVPCVAVLNSFLFLAVLGFELGTSQLLGKCSII